MDNQTVLMPLNQRGCIFMGLNSVIRRMVNLEDSGGTLSCCLYEIKVVEYLAASNPDMWCAFDFPT